MKLFVLGGGPAGLAVSQEVSENGQDFTLIEANKTLGGLAQSLPWKNYGLHDLGPHKIFTTDKNLEKKILSILPKSSWIENVKSSKVYIEGHYLPYPPSPFSLIGVYGFIEFLKMSLSALLKKFTFFKASQIDSFEDDLVSRLGKPVYNKLFKPTALKLWGEPQKLSSKLSQGRVQTPSITELILRLMKIQKTSSFEALTFKYPKGGLSEIWKKIEDNSKRNGNYLKNSRIVKIDHENKRINKITYETENELKEIDVSNDFVASTIPISNLLLSMGTNVPSEIIKDSNEIIQLNDLNLIFFCIEEKILFEESWIFVPDPKILFHRVSEQNSFDPDMVKEGSIVCCEVMMNTEEKRSLSDEDLLNNVASDLKEVSNKRFNIVDSKLIKLPKSYPVYLKGYEPKLKRIIDYLDSFENLKTIGRQGSFNYIGTLDAMDIGYGFGRWFCNSNLKEFSEERERTDHYPVLD
jgi:protoporphyrinogen oxidase